MAIECGHDDISFEVAESIITCRDCGEVLDDSPDDWTVYAHSKDVSEEMEEDSDLGYYSDDSDDHYSQYDDGEYDDDSDEDTESEYEAYQHVGREYDSGSDFDSDSDSDSESDGDDENTPVTGANAIPIGTHDGFGMTTDMSFIDNDFINGVVVLLTRDAYYSDYTDTESESDNDPLPLDPFDFKWFE